jgi:hypothetical protein
VVQKEYGGALGLTSARLCGLTLHTTLLWRCARVGAPSPQGEEASRVFPASAADSFVRQDVGGRVVSFMSCMPGSGPGTVKNRAEKGGVGTEKEFVLYNPGDNYYDSLGADMAKSGVSLDLFVAGPAAVDLATIAPAARQSAGAVHYYTSFNPNRDHERLVDHVTRLAARPLGVDGIMRVRTSTGEWDRLPGWHIWHKLNSSCNWGRHPCAVFPGQLFHAECVRC